MLNLFPFFVSMIKKFYFIYMYILHDTICKTSHRPFTGHTHSHASANLIKTVCCQVSVWSLLQINTSKMFAEEKEVILRLAYAYFVDIYVSTEHRVQAEGAAPGRCWSCSDGWGCPVPFSQSHLPPICRQHPCAVPRSGEQPESLRKKPSNDCRVLKKTPTTLW